MALRVHLTLNRPKPSKMNTEKQIVQQPVAIIGMGGMFAGSQNVKQYWRTLLNGIDCISEPPATHAVLNDYFDSNPQRPDHIYCNRGGFLPATPFDPTEFGIPPAALEATDTSQLLGLVAAKKALSDAGYGDGREFDRERTSVILGVTGTQELSFPWDHGWGTPTGAKPSKTRGSVNRKKHRSSRTSPPATSPGRKTRSRACWAMWSPAGSATG